MHCWGLVQRHVRGHCSGCGEPVTIVFHRAVACIYNGNQSIYQHFLLYSGVDERYLPNAEPHFQLACLCYRTSADAVAFKVTAT